MRGGRLDVTGRIERSGGFGAEACLIPSVIDTNQSVAVVERHAESEGRLPHERLDGGVERYAAVDVAQRLA